MNYKKSAKTHLKSSYWNVLIFTILSGFLLGLVGLIPVLGYFVVLLFSGSLVVAQILNIREVILFSSNGDNWQNAITRSLKDFLKYFAAVFVIGLFTFLWSLLFIIPGLIKTYSYSQTLYILAENPEMGILEAITKSREMMDGKKGELFILNLSFIGWIILGILTFGIGLIFLSPYISTTNAVFFYENSGIAARAKNQTE